jgi:hypothetical protein
MRSASQGHRRVMETILAILECTCRHCTAAHACACSILSRFRSGRPWTPERFSGKTTSRDMGCAQVSLSCSVLLSVFLSEGTLATLWLCVSLHACQGVVGHMHGLQPQMGA